MKYVYPYFLRSTYSPHFMDLIQRFDVLQTEGRTDDRTEGQGQSRIPPTQYAEGIIKAITEYKLYFGIRG